MTVIEDLLVGVRQDLAVREAQVSLAQLKEKATNVASPIDVMAHLRRADASKMQVFAEVKRASPSCGNLADIPEPDILAAAYQAGGASVVSCLTEQRRFKGSLEDFDLVRKAIDIPLLRKDFIVSSYQIWESRVHGADIILLIVAALEQPVLQGLLERTWSLGMEAIVEVHTREEAYRALDVGANIIGVNARNLKTLEVDRDTVPQVMDVIPDSIFRVAESGVRTVKDVMEYARGGANAVLVGEALVKDTNPVAALAEMVGVGKHPAYNLKYK